MTVATYTTTELEQWVLDTPPNHDQNYNDFIADLDYQYIIEIYEEDDMPDYYVFMDSDNDPVAWFHGSTNVGFK